MKKIAFTILAAAMAMLVFSQSFTMSDPAWLGQQTQINPLFSGLQLWLPFTSTTTTNDFSGYNRSPAFYTSATPSSGSYVTGADGIANHAISFNGTSQYVAYISGAKFYANYAPTIGTCTVWAYYNSSAAAQLITYEQGNLVNIAEAWPLSGYPSVILNIGNSTTLNTTSTNYTSGTWYLLSFDYDGASFHFYKNGVLDSTFAKTQTPSSFSGSSGFQIGRQLYSGSASGYFNGAMQDFRIYNRVLSAGEEAALYSAGPQHP